MIAAILQMLGTSLVFLLVQWRGLRETSRSTRMFAYAAYAASVGLWTYVMIAVHVPRPAILLESLLRPFSLLD